MTKWSVSGYRTGIYETMTGTAVEVEQQIRAKYPDRQLEFKGYTDQIDVFCRRKSDVKRRDRFLTCMAEG